MNSFDVFIVKGFTVTKHKNGCMLPDMCRMPQ